MAERIAPVLGLEGVEVKAAVERGGGWEIEVEVALPKRCASCGGKVHGHGRLPRRRVSHLWIGVEGVHLNWLPQRGVCQQCGKTVATRPANLEPWRRQTPPGPRERPGGAAPTELSGCGPGPGSEPSQPQAAGGPHGAAGGPLLVADSRRSGAERGRAQFPRHGPDDHDRIVTYDR